MSKTKKGGKKIGLDFTSKRLPGYPSAGKIAKEMTKSRERMKQKKLIINELKGN